MKIAHLPFCYYPDPVGGTEIYVRALALEQKRAGHDPIIIAPADQASVYEHEGLRVYRYRVDSQVADIAELYAAENSVDAAGFDRILSTEMPAVLHVHGYTRAVSENVLRAARERGARIVFTYHTPAATCVRGTLLRWGDRICDGRLDAQRCAACVLNAHGVPRLAAQLAGILPAGSARRLRGGRLATGLRMRELVARRHDSIRRFFENADRVVATADWAAALLANIGVPASKLVVSRQGTSCGAPAAPRARSGDTLRLAFFGRIDRSKGLHVLLEALALIRGLQLELHVYGIVQAEDAYARRLRRQAARDRRVTWHEPVAQDAVVDTLRSYDVLAVPSQWLETGPLVVLEAFAAGVPVVGSDLGGVRELVRDGQDGILVDATQPRAWAAAIGRLATERTLLDQLRARVRPPRDMQIVAREMELLYRDVLEAA
ncbi:MAG: glycosyltransferase [Gemmatimonadota bacterium]